MSGAVLRFDHVSLEFAGVRALDEVSLSVEAGHTVILFGAAGSGKSVLLKTALGLLRPTGGRVELFGEDITKMPESSLFDARGRVGVLFQEGGLFDSLTVEENVGYPILHQRKKRIPVGETSHRVREALRFVELEDTLLKFPSQLSGGMRRRVGIARATVTEPPLMLYDSPTAGLDPITANTIMALIVKARDTRNTTSLIVSHRYQDGHIMANYRWREDGTGMEPAPKGCGVHERTTFMVFQDGRIAFEGTQEELQRSTDPYVEKFKAGQDDGYLG